MIAPAIEFRIGGGGESSRKFIAADPDDRVKAIYQCLTKLDEPVMFLEVKRDVRSWQEWKDNIGSFEFMRVGVSGDYAAAEYVRGGFRSGQLVLDEARATFSPAPSASQPRVVYDACVPTYFPPDTVVPFSEVRQLMIDFALRGEWSDAAPWHAHNRMVA